MHWLALLPAALQLIHTIWCDSMDGVVIKGQLPNPPMYRWFARYCSLQIPSVVSLVILKGNSAPQVASTDVTA